jgi:hypothetical protein
MSTTHGVTFNLLQFASICFADFFIAQFARFARADIQPESGGSSIFGGGGGGASHHLGNLSYLLQPNYDQVLTEAFASAGRVNGFKGLNNALKSKPKALVVLYQREMFSLFKRRMALATPQVM